MPDCVITFSVIVTFNTHEILRCIIFPQVQWLMPRYRLPLLNGKNGAIPTKVCHMKTFHLSGSRIPRLNLANIIMVTTEKFFDYILSYSPINNIKDGAEYPACLITGGLNDPRVQVRVTCSVLHQVRRPRISLLNICAFYFQRSTMNLIQVLGASKV
jgi:hypothetical protein